MLNEENNKKEEIEDLNNQKYIIMPENIDNLDKFKDWIINLKLEENIEIRKSD